MESEYQGQSQLSADKTDLADMQFFETSTHIRASTAPSRPLTQIEQFKLSKKFIQLQQAVVCSNQLIHRSFDKFQLENDEGQSICQKYFQHLQSLCKTYNVPTATRDYRAKFSQAYKVLYKEGELSYLTEILDSAQQAYPYLWVNDEKYSFSQEVLDYGNKLMTEFFKLEHCLRDLYGKITQQPASISISLIVGEIRDVLLEFDTSWSTYQRHYVMQLMEIEIKARSLIAKAIQMEKCLTSVQIRQKMKGKILINCQDYLMTRGQLCVLIAQINNVANYVTKSRDDLEHSILIETEGILRRITRQQSKAVRILAEKIRSSFWNLRNLFRKYDKNIEMVDPQLRHNSDLVDALVEYEKSWERGANYFLDIQKKRYLLHFSGALEGMVEKHPTFKVMLDNYDSQIFLIIPCLLMLKSLDKDDKHLCKYFLPDLNKIGTKTFRLYFDLQKQFQEWKKIYSQHYHYYNILQKMIIGTDLTPQQKSKMDAKSELGEKILAKIKNLGNQLHRFNPSEWNSFMEVCIAGAVSE